MIRIYYPDQLNRNLQLEKQRHYIVNVHRLQVGHQLSLFNSQEGEYIFEIEKIDKNHVYCTKIRQVLNPERKQNISLAIPLIKPARLEWVMEKVTELGIKTVYLLHTDRTVKRNPDFDRLSRIVCAALQQSGRIRLPELKGPMTLSEFLDQADNIVIASPGGTIAPVINSPFATLVVGPEGCFTEAEVAQLKGAPRLKIATDAILRTETAAIAGIVSLKLLMSV